MHRRAAIALWALAAVALAATASGAHRADPRTPPAAPGLPPPFLSTAIVGGGGLTAAVDSYGNVVDLRQRPGGRPLIVNRFRRQRAGSVPAATGITVAAGRSSPAPLWKGTGQRQRYLPGTNVLVTRAKVAGASVRVTWAADPRRPVLARIVQLRPSDSRYLVRSNLAGPARIETRPARARAIVAAAARADRRWLAGAKPLGPGAPGWARNEYERSLLVLRALTDRTTGAEVAGARDFWAYVWPRDAAAGAMALAAAGYRAEARRVAAFLLQLDPEAAARFRADSSPVADGRPAPGDAAGWIDAAARAAGLPGPALAPPDWRSRQDYRERDDERGDYLGNAVTSPLAAGALSEAFGSRRGLLRSAGDPTSGLDSAAAWAVLPFDRPLLHRASARTLLSLSREAGSFGIRPAESWPDADPWMAPTAWSAAALATLGRNRAADRLLASLRRAATPAGLLPERVSRSTGIPRSTTPLALAHAWTVLALRARWPG